MPRASPCAQPPPLPSQPQDPPQSQHPLGWGLLDTRGMPDGSSQGASVSTELPPGTFVLSLSCACLPLPLGWGRSPSDPADAAAAAARARWPPARPFSHSVPMVTAAPILCSVSCLLPAIKGLETWPLAFIHLPCPGFSGGQQFRGPHPTRLRGSGNLPRAAAGDSTPGLVDAGPPCALTFLSAQLLRFCSTFPDEWTVFAQGSWAEHAPLHPGFFVTSPPLLAAAGGSLPPGECSTPDLQPSPSPESHNLVPSLPDLTGTGKAALGPRDRAKVPGRITQPHTNESLRRVRALPSQASGHCFQMVPKDQARVIRKGSVGTDHSCPQSKGVAGCSLTVNGDTAQEGGWWPGQLQDPHGPGLAHPLDPGWL